MATRSGARFGVGLLVSVVGALVLTAAPASARPHHHHHHHHHGGGGVTCGPGTVMSDGACVPGGPTGPTGNGNVTITPSDITMDLGGGFATTLMVTGLPPDVPISVTSFRCGPGKVSSAVTPIGSSDANGRIQAAFGDPMGCVPGTYPVTFTEGVSPFQTFTAFFTLHF